MSRRPQIPRWVDALLGVVYGALVVTFVGAAVLTYNRAFVPSVDVQLATDTLGSALQKGSDVKLNGVPVGEVSAIESSSAGAVLTLALDPDAAADLSADTTARLLPKTLFGERYVALQPAAAASATGLSQGDQLRQDRSAEAVELDEVLDELLPLLQSIQPQKLQAALSELAAMLRDRGGDLGDTFEAWGDYLTKLEPQVPQMAEDLSKLGTVAETFADAAPDLLAALDTFTVNAAMLVDKRADLTEVYARVIGAAHTTTGWVDDHEDTIEILSAESRKALEAAAPYAKQFPCLLKGFADFIPEMDRNLGKGTDEPGIHVRLNIVEQRGKYVAGRDTPRWSSGGKPRCPYVTGRTGTKPAKAKAAAATIKDEVSEPETIAPPPSSPSLLAASDLGPANSPGENQLIAELMAASAGTSTADYPGWSSLLLGPALRGTKVTLQ